MKRKNTVGKSWGKHYEDTVGSPPSPLLQEALKFTEELSEALDLGAGALKDTRFLLASGFKHVTAVDSEQLVSNYGQDLPKDKVEIAVSSFGGFAFPENKYDLVNAQFSLPFNGQGDFDSLIEKIKKSLKIGGVFTGQLFGIRDQWNVQDTKLVFHSKEVAEALFSDMDVLSFREVEKDSKTADGNPKHWHVFHIIAKRKKNSQ